MRSRDTREDAEPFRWLNDGGNDDGAADTDGPVAQGEVAASEASSASRSLRAAGLRCTMARVCVWQALDAVRGSVSADGLFRVLIERGTHMSIGTVYRVLGLFEARGLVLRQRDAERKALYRLKQHAFDAPLRLTCRDCGRSVAIQDAAILELLVKRAGEHGIHLSGEEIDIRVHCGDCPPE